VENNWKSTTVVCVRRNNSVVMVSDGQVTYGEPDPIEAISSSG